VNCQDDCLKKRVGRTAIYLVKSVPYTVCLTYFKFLINKLSGNSSQRRHH